MATINENIQTARLKRGLSRKVVAEAMVYNLETAQAFSALKPVRQEAFYISILKSFNEAVEYIKENGQVPRFSERLKKISDEAWQQNWFNRDAFSFIL